MTFPYYPSKKYIKPGSDSSFFEDKKGVQLQDNVNRKYIKPGSDSSFFEDTKAVQFQDNVNRKYIKPNTEEVGSKRPRYSDTYDTRDPKDKDKDKDKSQSTPKKVHRGSENDDFANGNDFIAF